MAGYFVGEGDVLANVALRKQLDMPRWRIFQF
jgi:hypothetical protein